MPSASLWLQHVLWAHAPEGHRNSSPGLRLGILAMTEFEQHDIAAQNIVYNVTIVGVEDRARGFALEKCP